MILSNKYQLIKPINSGRYGSIYLAKSVCNDKHKAIKILLKERHDMNPFTNKVTTMNEITNMTKLTKEAPHKNIVALDEVLEDSTAYYLVEELCSGHTLQDYIYKLSTIDDFAHPLTSIVDGIVHCHANDIVFGDIKPANVVFSIEEDCYKLTDFGSSVPLNPKTKEGVLFTTSPFIAPPEALSSAPRRPIVTPKFDVYSIGILAKTLLVSNPILYKAMDDSIDIESFIHACLQERESLRLSSSQMQEYWYDILATIKKNKESQENQ